MKLLFKVYDNPLEEFLLGIFLVDGFAKNEITGEEREIVMLSFGFLFCEISIIW